jgi:hypothetical protein
MSDSRTHKLSSFIEWARLHVKGDEKGEAHIFLDRLFQAFGHPGSLDVGGEPEFRIRKASEDGGGTAFADFVWKPLVLIEMKKRGTILSKHYRQAFDYWTRLVPGRPRFVILCNFDEFEIYDFETQMDSPVGRVKLADLAENYGSLAFLFPEQQKPVFENEHVAVTREAAAKLAKCFNLLVARGVDRSLAQRFILQILIAFFAEDIGLMERYFVTRLLDETDEKTSYDLLGGLFRAMNNRDGNAGGRFKDVHYFNGGVFSQPAELELQGPEIVLLRKCAASDWSKVQPEIFGTVFEQTLEKEERHASGAHFTHPADIMKIVGPTIVEPWRKEIEKADTARRLGELLHRLQEFQVLDPACGSGNFLYIAYREMKRLEARIYERLDTEFPSKAAGDQMRISFLSAQNFHGMDINPFAVELAKVTMMIARKLAIDELHITERPLPLDNLDSNFIASDALLIEGPDGKPVRSKWAKADAIIGNPPFLGAKLLKPELGPDYVKQLRSLYPEVPGMADFCVYWFRRAHDHLPPCTPADPVAGRAGLVGTQNIRNNASRVGGLDHIVKDGTIIEAVDNQPWSGEANVHVSIANWVKTQDPVLLPKQRRLWHKVEPSDATKKQWKKQGKKSSKEYELNFRDVPVINSALSDQTDVSIAVTLVCNTKPPCSFNGQMLGHEGFLLTKEQRDEILTKDPHSSAVIHPYLNGLEVLTKGTSSRFVLDFEQMDQLTAAGYSGAFDWVKERVLPDRKKKADEGKDSEGTERPHHKAFFERWWQLSFGRSELLASLKKIPRYLACSLVTKHPVFIFVDSAFRPSNLLQVFTFYDDYSFGVIQSSAHAIWFKTKSSKLTERFRFGEGIWNTFPWPQDPNPKAITAVAEAGREVRRIREEALQHLKGGLRALYRTLELPGANPLKDAHAALDAAVLAAYGFDPKADLLAQLLDLNQSVAAKIAAGQPVTAPGLPPIITNPAPFITPDCINPTAV